MDRGAVGRRSRTEASLKSASADAAYRAGVRLLAVRDRTSAELARLLAIKGFGRAESGAALDRLQAEGYLNDRRFVTVWARSRVRTKPMGRYRLSQELAIKGVEASLMRDVLQEIYAEGEELLARRAMAGKLSVLERRSASSRTAQVARFLQRRGFTTDIIRRMLDEERQR